MKSIQKHPSGGNCDVCGEKNAYTSKLCRCGAILPWVKPSWGNCAQCGQPYPYDFKKCQCGAVLPWAEIPPTELQKLVTTLISGFTLRSIEGHRRKFREGPVGGWSGADVVWQFNPDGTGWYQLLAGFSPPDAEYPIIWKLDGPFTIWLKELPRGTENNRQNDTDEEDIYPWVKVQYGFKWLRAYGDKQLVMVDDLGDDVLDDSFSAKFFEWWRPSPVTYSGPNETPR